MHPKLYILIYFRKMSSQTLLSKLGKLPRIPQLPPFPEKLKGGRIEKWKTYWMGVVSDYKEACLEVKQMCTSRPYRTAVLASTGVFLGYCVKTNPTEQDYKTNFMENGLELGQISDTLRNGGCDNLQNYVSRAFNAQLVRRLNMGILSIMWVDDYSPDLGLFSARCDYLKPSWTDIRHRIIDVGFLGKWWISERKMAEADINENEWNESGKATQPENQLRRMW
ncbi:mitochondrial import inner membrane translocase subunit Tim29 [Eurytemora carolleeae]|uniref:mitochondrial import inner membrane translocase subunit Tim29 n=1 Tax=Eurytemora carolleeae TaxID=1294199 RepID=UPI000C77DB82|nr:mitochondrial import inner membrane translocase subunit Tim29 [Eurytemora carolleeae]|eukprot:XP_023340788.1 mitochondrial import inner membrane translocase subunit Tim29-like [Eurytemora affinis]